MYVSTCVCVCVSRGIWNVLAQSTIGRAKIAGENVVANGGRKKRRKLHKNAGRRENPLRESRVPFRVAGQSDHVFRSRIRIKRILIFAVGQGRRICIREIPPVRAYGNLRRAREISLAGKERSTVSFRGFPLVTDSTGRSGKKIQRFSRRTRATFFLFLRAASLYRDH